MGRGKRTKFQPHWQAIDRAQDQEQEKVDEEFEVREFTDVQVKQGNTWLRTKWKGYGAEEDSWEPLISLIQQVPKQVVAYLRTRAAPSVPTGSDAPILKSRITNRHKLQYLQEEGGEWISAAFMILNRPGHIVSFLCQTLQLNNNVRDADSQKRPSNRESKQRVQDRFERIKRREK